MSPVLLQHKLWVILYFLVCPAFTASPSESHGIGVMQQNRSGIKAGHLCFGKRGIHTDSVIQLHTCIHKHMHIPKHMRTHMPRAGHPILLFIALYPIALRQNLPELKAQSLLQLSGSTCFWIFSPVLVLQVHVANLTFYRIQSSGLKNKHSNPKNLLNPKI